MKTECSSRLRLGEVGRRNIVGDFSGEQISTDGGAVLLAEKKTGIVAAFGKCFRDHRFPPLVVHSTLSLVTQRVFGLALGYEDLVGHDALRVDPLLSAAVGKVDELAGKSILNRLELSTGEAGAHRYNRIELDMAAAADSFVDQFVRSTRQQQRRTPDRLVLDLDTSDVPLHGHQEGRFFHGYYNEYCYLPLYIFCGEHLLAVRLQTADHDGARHAVEELERIVARLRTAWPDVQFTIRADSGFCRDEIFS